MALLSLKTSATDIAPLLRGGDGGIVLKSKSDPSHTEAANWGVCFPA